MEDLRIFWEHNIYEVEELSGKKDSNVNLYSVLYVYLNIYLKRNIARVNMAENLLFNLQILNRYRFSG